MNMVLDKIFVVVFTAFIAVITVASVVIAKNPVAPSALLMDVQTQGERNKEISMESDDEALVSVTPGKERPEFVVIPAEELLGGETPTPTPVAPIADAIKHDVDVVVGVPVSGAPESQFVVISRADLDHMLTKLENAVTNGVKKASQKDPESRWQRILGLAWAGIKLPYQILMMVPAEVRVLVMLYFTLKFKPEVFGWAFKHVVKNSPGLGAFLMKEFGIPMAEEVSHVIVDAAKANIAEFVPGVVVNGAATVTAAAAESAAQLANTWMPEWVQGFALSLGY